MDLLNGKIPIATNGSGAGIDWLTVIHEKNDSEMQKEFCRIKTELGLESTNDLKLRPRRRGAVDANINHLCKNALPQENGYTVLRFLAEDIGRSLNDILDCILRVLSRNNAKKFRSLRRPSDFFGDKLATR